MKNWLGQDIVPGAVVYRGAREGNTSSFKIGVVESVNEDKGIARVAWKYDPRGYFYRRDSQGNSERITAPISRMSSSGSPSIDSLVVVDVDLDILEKKVVLAEEWRDGNMSTATYEQELDTLS